jgi:hypothetical protein
MITSDQIQSIIDDLDYEAEYFTWQINTNSDTPLKDFFYEIIEPELLTKESYCKRLAILQFDKHLSWEEAESGTIYKCYTDNEADNEAIEITESLIEDVYLAECPDYLRNYIDIDKFTEDILEDGRGSLLNNYNSEEYKEIVDGIVYYIYHA